VELLGDDIVFDRDLDTHFHDEHQLSAHDTMPVTRSFLIPCELLNEAVGRDAIYIRLYVRSSRGETITARSATVKDPF
jgi:hypothetical protein